MIAGLFGAVALAFAVSTSPVCAAEWVHFNSAALPPSPFKIALAQQRGEPVPVPEPGAGIAGWLDKPAGGGLFPAVVFLHGCTGATEIVLRRIGERIVSWGYAFLGVDSFGPRGIRERCQDGSGGIVPDRVRDAYGALEYLAGLPFVDPARIALLGASQGGSVALLAVERTDGAGLADRRFRAAIAEYPYCLRGGAAFTVPVLVGELDDWTPARRCREMVEGLAPDGAPVRLVAFSGAYHAFNVVDLKGRPTTLQGHRLAYDEAAVDAADVEMRRFLDERLRQ